MSNSPEPGADQERPPEESPPDPDEVVEAVLEEAAPGAAGIELPEDPDEAVALLINELLAAREAAELADDKWRRSVAEFDNYRKRSARVQEDSIVRASERVMRRLLPVLDSFDAALAMADKDGSTGRGLREGMSSTRDLLLSTLAQEGLEPIKASGAAFDPTLHEAAQMADGTGTMVVAAEFRRGYQLKGRVIRPALVAVGYEPDEPEAPEEAEEAEEEPA